MYRLGIRTIIVLALIINICARPVSAGPALEARVLHSGFRADTGAFVLLLDRGTDGGMEQGAKYILSANGKEEGTFNVTGAMPGSVVGTLDPFAGAKLPAVGAVVALAVPDKAEKIETPAPEPGAAINSNSILAEGYKVGPGDILKLKTYPADKLPGETIVRPDMTISLPFVGIVNVADMTIFQLADKIQKLMARDFKNPWVEVSVSEYHSMKVRIYGSLATSIWRVSGAGEYALKENTRLIEFFTSIGGLDKDADISNIKLFRKDGAEIPIDFAEIGGNPASEKNIFLQNGDVIYVPALAARKTTVRVIALGKINKQGAYLMDQDRSGLVEAITQSGGVLAEAALDRVQILRSDGNGQKTEIVNASRIIAGEAPDFALHDGDIIYVPQRSEKKGALDRVNNVLKDVLPTINFMYLITRM